MLPVTKFDAVKPELGAAGVTLDDVLPRRYVLDRGAGARGLAIRGRGSGCA